MDPFTINMHITIAINQPSMHSLDISWCAIPGKNAYQWFSVGKLKM
jgi:hypothetical protein